MIQVVKAGLLDTIQDSGRIGYQQFGVIQSGTMDTVSSRIANLLVGNAKGESVLEVTLVGPTLLFKEACLISLCGGDFTPEIDGMPVPMWKPVIVKENSILTIGAAKKGSRLVIAVAGGFDVPRVLNSSSTYLKAAIGGFLGRSLQKGDSLPIKTLGEKSKRMYESLFGKLTESFCTTTWSVAHLIRPFVGESYSIRVLAGRQKDLFTSQSQNFFLSSDYTINSQSDRMGYRLHGPQLLLTETKELLSEAVTFGTVQVPANGQPIVLMADRQTTGGYPKIAQVISVDLPLLAQAKPGDSIRFKEVSLHTAQQLLQQLETTISDLRLGIELKLIAGGIRSCYL
ncbi:5-oxoprolinase subunit C family protein [Sporosarcina aquimarina]|uniref:Biotin-dependent carboxyltransferase family protein n=1 Tax=Sporosarcina aquimarina TaxID=114975 RepID=A0ABU4FYP4_9BACL|nr:biotin-dependent carboxyltransferase family protein [Sporosarcina aquimarina]MDW0109854.1 biotin-dependent carboxyltransferase family protein [Sporosarcina aquimarina]